VAEFLMDTTLLDRTMIGEFLGERADFNLAVRHPNPFPSCSLHLPSMCPQWSLNVP
jgi:hypothetical protein